MEKQILTHLIPEAFINGLPFHLGHLSQMYFFVMFSVSMLPMEYFSQKFGDHAPES